MNKIQTDNINTYREWWYGETPLADIAKEEDAMKYYDYFFKKKKETGLYVAALSLPCLPLNLTLN
jgi:hypothetical protein